MDNDTEVPECIDYTRLLHMWYRSHKKMEEWSGLTSVRIVFGFLYCSIFCFGIFTNGSAIKVLFKKGRLNGANIFLINLMLADMLLCFTAVPISPIVIVWKQWYLGEFMCKFVPFAQSVSVMLISWSLTVIAFDRYLHIVDVTKPQLELWQAGAIIAVSWMVAILINVPSMLSYSLISGKDAVNPGDIPFCGSFCHEKWWNKRSLKKIYGTLVLCVQFAFPMVIITYCYGRILWIVQRDMIVKNRQYSHTLSRKHHQVACRTQRRVTFILVGMVVAFLVSWFPLTLMNILRDYATVPKFVRDQLYFWGLICNCMAMSTVIWNPLLCFSVSQSAREQKSDNTGRRTDRSLLLEERNTEAKYRKSHSTNDIQLRNEALKRGSISLINLDDELKLSDCIELNAF